jgi:hypothetical protein
MSIAARRSILPVMMLVLLLAGCATASVSLTADEMRTIRIERVDVSFTEDAGIMWDKAEVPYVERVKAARAAARAKQRRPAQEEEASVTEHQEIMSTPEAKQYMQATLAAELKKRLGAAILPKFQGTRRAVLEVKVHAMIIPHALQRVVLGGTPVLGTVTILRDSVTGKELAKLDRNNAAMAGNGVIGVLVDQGFSDLDERVFNKYMENVASWLEQNREG